MWYLAPRTTLPLQGKSISVVPLWDNNSTTHLCVHSCMMNQTQLAPQPRPNVLKCQHTLSCRFSSAPPICVSPFSGAGSCWCCRQTVMIHGVSSQSRGRRMQDNLFPSLWLFSCPPHQKQDLSSCCLFLFIRSWFTLWGIFQSFEPELTKSGAGRNVGQLLRFREDR